MGRQQDDPSQSLPRDTRRGARQQARLARAWALRWRARERSRAVAAELYADAVSVYVRGRAARLLAWHAKWRGEFEAARHHAENALNAARLVQDRECQGDVLSILAVIDYSQGDHGRAGQQVDTGLRLLRAVPPGAAWVDLRITMSTLHRYAGQTEAGDALLRETLTRIEAGEVRLARIEALQERARLLHNLARNLLADRRIAEARDAAEASLTLARLSRNRVIEPYVLEVAGDALQQQGIPDLARRVLEEGLALGREGGDQRVQCQILEGLGRAEMERGYPAAAVPLLQRGLAAASAMDYPLWTGRFLNHLSLALERSGHHRAALDTLRRQGEIERQMFRQQAEAQLTRFRAEMELHEAESARATLARERDAAARASELKTDFLANMSHELRAPLHGVLGMAQLLDHTTLEKTQQTYVDGIRQCGEILLSVISDVLDISKIEAGLIEVERVPVCVRRSLRAACGTARAEALRRGLHLVFDETEATGLTVLADRDRLVQIMTNLLGNAMKFTPSGTVQLWARRAEDGRSIRIGVSDSGPGVPTDERERIFTRFYQIHPSRSESAGAGLGLGICRELVQLMGGEITVADSPWGGATFEIRLPTSDTRPAKPAADQPSPVSPALIQPNRRPMAIVVDDQDFSRFVLERCLRHAGFDSHSFALPEAALDSPKLASADLLVTDLWMAGIGGLGLIRAVRQRPVGRSGLPVLAVSADATPGNLEAARNAGADSVLSKPVDLARMTDEISRLVPTSRA